MLTLNPLNAIFQMTKAISKVKGKVNVWKEMNLKTDKFFRNIIIS